MTTVTRSKIIRADQSLYDGKTTTFSRLDASGGTTTGLRVNDDVDVLQVYGSGTAYTRGTIAAAVQSIGSSVATLVFAPGTWTIDDDLTIPSNMPCIVKGGCIFNVSSGKTLTFSAGIFVEYPTWTSGAGTVLTSAGATGFPNY